MPQFEYKVKKSASEMSTGVVEAESQSSAVAQLRDQGFFPISIVEVSQSNSKSGAAPLVSRVRLKDRNVFFRQLASLLQSGMPIVHALGTLKDQTTHPKMNAVITGLHDSVQQGNNFADSLENYPKVFPNMYVSLVRAGEAGGMLEDVLWRMVNFGEKDEELRGKAIGALVYPIFLLGVSGLTIFIMVSFVFPKFVELFKDFDASLPFVTQVVITFSAFMGQYWWLVILGIALLAAGLRSYSTSENGRSQLDHLWLRLPMLGSLVGRYEMAKFARTLGTLFDNGVPVLTALKITADTLTNSHIVAEVEQIREKVGTGESISGSLRNSQYFPPMVVNMIAVGEESGELGAVTQRVADTYDIEVDRAVKAFTSVLEPLIIVIMGGVVGFLVIAMLLPMMTLSAQVR
jgi:type II secretion system protein F